MYVFRPVQQRTTQFEQSNCFIHILSKPLAKAPEHTSGCPEFLKKTSFLSSFWGTRARNNSRMQKEGPTPLRRTGRPWWPIWRPGGDRESTPWQEKPSAMFPLVVVMPNIRIINEPDRKHTREDPQLTETEHLPSQPPEAGQRQPDMSSGLPPVEATSEVWVPDSAGSTSPEKPARGTDPS